jgi:hypothetical protein
MFGVPLVGASRYIYLSARDRFAFFFLIVLNNFMVKCHALCEPRWRRVRKCMGLFRRRPFIA